MFQDLKVKLDLLAALPVSRELLVPRVLKVQLVPLVLRAFKV